jgi:alkylation response protein AidB-like acyl-CoA dehydrogenase
MDFSWTPEQVELYQRAFAFARAETEADWKRLGEFGLLGLSLGVEHGGSGLPAVDTARVLEGLAHGGLSPGRLFAASAHLFAAAMPIAEHGSPELQQRFLPRLASGSAIGANAISESTAGSDAYALKCRAERDGDDYVLSGAKSFVTNGPVADVFLIYASTNPKHGWLGVSAFVVERDAPGLRVGSEFVKHGLSGSTLSSLYLEACRVPAANRLGDEGAGARIFEASMRWERCCLFALYLGVLQRQLEQVIAYARERKQFGKPIGKFQAVSHRIVEMKLRLEAARLLLYRAAWESDQGRDASEAISLAKLAVSEAAVQSGIDAIRIHGGAGVIAETGVALALADALPSLLFSGTNEIQRELVARKLGL